MKFATQTIEHLPPAVLAPRPRRIPVRIPVLAPIALKLLQITSAEKASMKDIATLLQADCALSTDVLRMANSPLWGRRFEVKSIMQALGLLGLERLRSLVVTVALRDLGAAARHSMAFRAAWRHSLGTAITADSLARAEGAEPDEAYTEALLHDVGRLALISASPSTAEHLLAEALDCETDLLKSLREHFGIDHRELGRRLAAEWNLPSNVRRALEHGCASDFMHGESDMLTAACRLAHTAGFPAPGAPQPDADSAQRIPSQFRDLAAAADLPHLVALRINAFECSLLML